MKLKFLSLFLILGMFALGTNVKAQPAVDQSANSFTAPSAEREKAMSPAEAKAAVGDTFDTVCKWVAGATSLPQECHDACTKKSLPGLACCLKSADQSGKIPQAVKTVLSALCKTGCNRGSCAIHKSLADTCGDFCCNTNFGSVTNCLKANGGKTCKDYPPDCNVAAHPTKTEW